GAGRGARLEEVVRTRRASAGTGLGHVTLVDRGAADGARVARRVLARVAGAVALVQRAGIGVRRAGRPERLLGVGRARGARARAGLSGVALARGRAAGGARVARRVLAGGARAVALIEGARVAIVRAGRAGVASGMRARRARAAAHVGGAGVAVVGAGGAPRLAEVGGAGR